jgi:Helix-turn-helix domain
MIRPPHRDRPAPTRETADRVTDGDMTAKVIQGVLFDHSDVAEMLEEYDFLMRIAWQHRERIPQCIVARRRELAELTTCATTCADLRGDAPGALGGSQFGPGIIGPKKAAEILETTEANVRDLCKRHRLIAMQPDGPGGSWYIVKASVDDHKARTRKGA